MFDLDRIQRAGLVARVDFHESLGSTSDRALELAAADEGPLPLLVLHDVGWPYGRRDLYYAPGQIPEEHRQPYRTAGMVMGRSELVDEGGMNPTMCNAEHEGGPRNGVMTAVDDFVAEHDRPLRVVVLPVYFGLALVMEVELLDQYPALASLLDELEGRDGQAALAVLAETNRPTFLYETHLPRRTYIPKLDVRMDLLTATATSSRCPYKGTASYWSANVNGKVHDDLAWSYPTPLPESEGIAGLVCFYDEFVDLTVDGKPQERPHTAFSRRSSRS